MKKLKRIEKAFQKKMFIFMSLVLLSSFSIAHADDSLLSTDGLPDQDPVVKMLRDKFEKSSSPSLASLKLGKTWDCKIFSSLKADFNVYDSESLFTFNTYDGMIINDLKDSCFKSLAFDRISLSGAFTSGGPGIIHLRASPEGDLIAETTVRSQDYEKDASFWLKMMKSISDPNAYSVQYVVCPANKVH